MKEKAARISVARNLMAVAGKLASDDGSADHELVNTIVAAAMPVIRRMQPDEFGRLVGSLLLAYTTAGSADRTRTAVVWAAQAAFGPQAASFVGDVLLFMVAAARDRDVTSGFGFIRKLREALDDIEAGNLSKYITGEG